MCRTVMSSWLCAALGLVLLTGCGKPKSDERAGGAVAKTTTSAGSEYNLDVQSSISPANVFVTAWDSGWCERARASWLAPESSVGTTPLSKRFSPGRYLVAVQVSVGKGDRAYKQVELAPLGGCSFSPGGARFVCQMEENGARISEPGQWFAEKAAAIVTDPFVDDGYAAAQGHHLKDRILYFRIYEVDVRGNEMTKVSANFSLKP